MLDPASSAAISQTADSGRKVLHWRKNDRMGGMVPVWEKPSGSKDLIAENLSGAAQGTADSDFHAALSYAGASDQGSPQDNEEFGFGDLIDMVNPLQHLPIVSYVYREITGDNIRPISKIIGDGIYGGVAGAAVGLVDTVVEYETGRSVAGNVVAMVTNGESPHYRSQSTDKPEQRLTQAVRTAMAENPVADLPGTAIAFADLRSAEDYEQYPVAEGRTAGKMWRKHIAAAHETQAPPSYREPITELALSPMPPRRSRYND